MKDRPTADTPLVAYLRSRRTVDTTTPGDYGADPLPSGLFRMVPSGDIVDYHERTRRLMERAARGPLGGDDGDRTV
jgi:hypothetical protein